MKKKLSESDQVLKWFSLAPPHIKKAIRHMDKAAVYIIEKSTYRVVEVADLGFELNE